MRHVFNNQTGYGTAHFVIVVSPERKRSAKGIELLFAHQWAGAYEAVCFPSGQLLFHSGLCLWEWLQISFAAFQTGWSMSIYRAYNKTVGARKTVLCRGMSGFYLCGCAGKQEERYDFSLPRLPGQCAGCTTGGRGQILCRCIAPVSVFRTDSRRWYPLRFRR